MLKKIFYNNKQLILSSAATLLIFGTIKFCRHSELKSHGIVVEGTIIECKMVNVSGTCVVKVEYITLEGAKKITTNTLYQKSNCQIGKKVRLQYSDISELTHVIEESE